MFLRFPLCSLCSLIFSSYCSPCILPKFTYLCFAFLVDWLDLLEMLKLMINCIITGSIMFCSLNVMHAVCSTAV